MVTSFWDAFKNSTILQGLLAIIIWTGIVYMVVTGHAVDIPDGLWGAGVLVLGFYFGAKVQQAGFNSRAQLPQ